VDTAFAGGDPRGLARVESLLAHFLANRGDRTRYAYSVDVEDFGRYLGEAAAGAVARLLANGPRAGRHLAVEYAIDLRARGLAQATVTRRLATLRALAGDAHDLGVIDWSLEVPNEDQVSAAIRERADQASYMLPRHPSEVDRLDLQHYALMGAMGAHFLAPVEEAGRILDVGCGTGQWAFDMCRQFPGAVAVGFDLVASKPGGPASYHCVRGNALHGLPFRDDRFDFVHQRLLVTGVPLAAWSEVVSDLVRVTRPGGWVELVEPRMTFEGAGPATERLNDLALAIAGSLLLDTTSVVFGSLDGYLQDAGLTNVTRQQVRVPIGAWGGEVGSLMATDTRAGFTRLCEVMQARSRLSVQEGNDLIVRALEEWQQRETAWTFAIAFGQKPG
jgi:SAM-dependent methyltransferase